MFTGQLIGGPDNGNLVTSDTATFNHETVSVSYLQGKDEPTIVVTKGRYVWDAEQYIFVWDLFTSVAGFTNKEYIEYVKSQFGS